VFLAWGGAHLFLRPGTTGKLAGLSPDLDQPALDWVPLDGATPDYTNDTIYDWPAPSGRTTTSESYSFNTAGNRLQLLRNEFAMNRAHATN
jgi:hypothetical protein